MKYLYPFLFILIMCCEKKKTISFEFELSPSTYNSEKNDYVYLYNNSKKELVDSILIKVPNNNFIIKLETTYDVSDTYMLYINDFEYYKGKSYPFKRQLGYINPFKKNEVYHSFYIEEKMNPILFHNSFKSDPKGKTIIRNDFENDRRVLKPISKQNDILLKKINLKYYDTSILKQDKKTIDENIKLIKTYPYSVHLLHILYLNKTYFRIQDLYSLLEPFDAQLKRTFLFKEIERYLELDNSVYDTRFPDFVSLEDTKGDFKNLGDSVSTLNLIVYWAWWCGPCRREIPHHKNLYEKYKKQGLNVVYISIDGNKSKWFDALREEDMKWGNFIVNKKSLSELGIYFDLNSVPKSYLYDKNKKLIKKYSGFDEDSIVEIENYMKTIN